MYLDELACKVLMFVQSFMKICLWMSIIKTFDLNKKQIANQLQKETSIRLVTIMSTLRKNRRKTRSLDGYNFYDNTKIALVKTAA
jgi:hypothetical protein